MSSDDEQLIEQSRVEQSREAAERAVGEARMRREGKTGIRLILGGDVSELKMECRD